MPVHKSKAITYITPEARAEAIKRQNLVIRGKGMAHNFDPLGDRKKGGRGKRQAKGRE